MSAIAKTASITLITAVPGSGKSLRVAWYLEQAVKALGGAEAADGVVFACNINGLTIPGVTDFPDPTKWEELPAGSILAVDEAQKFFRAARGDAPEYIKAMEEIRHRGIRMILITQHPALIHPNIRALVGLHEHLVRENGKESATVFRRSRVIDNVRSDAALAVEDHESWAYPKHVYDLYKSAEVHTVKRTVPSKYKRAAILLSLAVCLVGFVVWTIGKKMTPPEQQTAIVDGEATNHDNAGAAPADKTKPKWETVGNYAADHLPRFPTMPHTAPVFDSRPAVADPELYCMSSKAGQGADGWRDESVICLTEQGTVYDIPAGEARRVARYGTPYNAYRRPSVEQRLGAPIAEQQAAQQRGAARASGAPVATISAPQISGYGDTAIQLNPQ